MDEGRPIELFVLASGGALQIAAAMEIALAAQREGVDRRLVLGPKFAHAEELLRPHWHETHVLNEADLPGLRRRRHARLAAAVADRLSGKHVSVIYGCDVPSTRILATKFPSARVTLFDEGSSTIPLSRQRVARLTDQKLSTAVRDRLKLALGIDGPPIPVAHYVSAFEPELTRADSLEPLTFDNLRRQLSGVVEPELGWIVGSRSREDAQLGEDLYLQLLRRACDHLRARGCRSISYFAYPGEVPSPLRSDRTFGIDEIVAGALHRPMELVLLHRPELPGAGVVAMPRTSASVSLALLLRETHVPVVIVQSGRPNRSGRNNDLDDHLASLAHRKNPRVAGLHFDDDEAPPGCGAALP